jgi:hypothetical protein
VLLRGNTVDVLLLLVASEAVGLGDLEVLLRVESLRLGEVVVLRGEVKARDRDEGRHEK